MNYFNPYNQGYTMPVAQLTGTTPQAIQNGGLVSVMSEQEARSYPVAPGNSVTMKDENQPYIYEKTMSFSQLDTPVFKKYRLVEEKAPAQNDDINGRLQQLTERIEKLEGRLTPAEAGISEYE